MNLLINNPVQATWIFTVMFVAVCLLWVRQKKHDGLSLEVTQELKGFAILSVIFAHIGYFLVADHQFLFPLSIMAGVGVNTFLFLSGYGLAASRIAKSETVLQFYKRRLLKLYVPFWLVLGGLFLFQPQLFEWQSVLGFFPRADMFQSLNAPLWYFTMIVAYYLLFPLVFSKKHPWVSAIVLYSISYYIVTSEFLAGVVTPDVLRLYKVHLIAFPLGVAVFGMKHLLTTVSTVGKRLQILLIPLALTIGYFGIHSGVGESTRLEQSLSLLTMGLIILFFIIKKREWRLLSIFGLYSYEIYLFHWPLLLRYEFLYGHVPAWLATMLYLIVFICIAYVLRKVIVWRMPRSGSIEQ